MGTISKSCCGSNNEGEIGPQMNEINDRRLKQKSRIATTIAQRGKDAQSMQSYDMNENTYDEDMIDTRWWDRDYDQWVKNVGPMPGPHPDPECIWNTKPEEFDRNEYKQK